MSSKQIIITQFERLKRHYNSALYTYDSISLLDLVHTLRIWTELKNEISALDFPNISKPMFSSAAPVKTIKKITKGEDYVWVGFGSTSVTTYASNGEIFFCPYFENKMKATIGGRFRKLENNGLSIQSVHFCKTDIDEEYLKKDSLSIQNISKTKFDHWLGTEAARIYYRNQSNLVSISREMLIKRLANTLNASHPQKENTGLDSNIFDEHISYLLSFTCGGLPLPYFIALKIAQDIIDVMPKVFML